MSLLETIKNLFGKLTAESSAPVKEEEAKPSDVSVPKKKVTPIATSNSSPSEATAQLQIPEDSTLKRHFISQLKCEIEAEMSPRPTESTLKRHYDTTVQARLDSLVG